MKNIFKKEVSEEVIERINNLKPNQQRLWGKMDVAQMLAHLNIQYQAMYENEKFKKPNFIKRFLMIKLLKPIVTGDKPFKKNGRTAPYFIVNSDKDFEAEKSKLIDNIRKTQQNGVEVLLPRDTKSFGKLTAGQWNNMLYKHIDHHLQQFGV
jgi:hypothetical protein